MPQPTAVLQVEGVLRKPITGATIDTGRRLYLGLSQFFRIVLVTDETDHDRINTWLGMEGYARHDHVVYGDGLLRRMFPDDEPWLITANTLKVGYGYDLDLIVLPDPHDAAVLIKRGYNTLLFTQAAYAFPEWRPDHPGGVKPWSDLETEILKGRAMRATDKRMEDELR